MPPFDEASPIDPTLNDLAPTELRADAGVLLKVGSKPVLGIVLESQLRADEAKLYAWPSYAVNARARHRCPFVVLVVTLDAATARWAAQPIDLGGGTWHAVVIGPEMIPRVTDVVEAVHDPLLAVLSIMAHGRDHDAQTAATIASAASVAALELSGEMRTLCYSLIDMSIGEIARKIFTMLPEGERFYSENQRRWYEEGEAKGSRRGQAKSVLTVLEARGIAVSPEQREHILQCTDAAVLDGWLKKAVNAKSADELTR